MPYFNSNRPYTPLELVNKISEEEGVNRRSAERKVSKLLEDKTLEKHVITVKLARKEYQIVLYEYLGLYVLLMSYSAYLVGLI